MALHPLRVLSLCSGAGCHDLALHGLFRARTVCYVEREAFAAAQLVALFRAGVLDAAPVWSDLGTFDARPWRGAVDCVVAGLPCQPYSVAGKRLGNDDARAIGADGDGPIVHAARIIAECDPAVAFFENVPAWVTGGYFREFGDELCRLGYTIQDPLFLAASDVGASHRRERVWLLAVKPGRGQRVLRESSRLGWVCAERSGLDVADPRSDIGAEQVECRAQGERARVQAEGNDVRGAGRNMADANEFRGARPAADLRPRRRESRGEGGDMANPRWECGDGLQPDGFPECSGATVVGGGGGRLADASMPRRGITGCAIRGDGNGSLRTGETMLGGCSGADMGHPNRPDREGGATR